MKKIRFVNCLPLLMLILLLQACKCGNITCPALDARYTAWLPYKNGDVITFTNSAGKEVRFTASFYQVSEAKNLECTSIGKAGCKCPPCPEARGEVSAHTTDTTWHIRNAQGQSSVVLNNINISISKPNVNEDKVLASYTILDHHNVIQIGPSLGVNQYDNLLATYTIGGRTYSNVVVHESDTTLNRPPNPFPNIYCAVKSYYNKEFGIIAFYDLTTRSLFYRKP